MNNTVELHMARFGHVLPADRLAEAISEGARQFPDRLAIVSDAGSPRRSVTTYAALSAAVHGLEKSLASLRPPGVIAVAKEVQSLISFAAACGRQRVPLAILSSDARDLTGSLAEWLLMEDSLSLPTGGNAPAEVKSIGLVPPPVVVATSGTSGPPKLVAHSWDSVHSAARLSSQWHGLGWVLVYDASRWAGIQVWMQALLTGGTVVVPSSRDPDVVARTLAEESVAVLPGTPTLLRRMLTFADRRILEKVRVARITLGGEAADNILLNEIRRTFPSAGVTQVYATTELGEVFRVADGRAGFPANWVGKALPSGARLSVRRDGELVVQLARDTAAVATGDVVGRSGDRYEFIGRRGDVILVGGTKVYPNRVEDVLRSVAGVVDARVWGLPNAITGEIVTAEIVVTDPLPHRFTADSLQETAVARCRDVLDAASVPRLISIVPEIKTTVAGKTPRRGTRK